MRSGNLTPGWRPARPPSPPALSAGAPDRAEGWSCQSLCSNLGTKGGLARALESINYGQKITGWWLGLRDTSWERPAPKGGGQPGRREGSPVKLRRRVRQELMEVVAWAQEKNQKAKSEVPPRRPGALGEVLRTAGVGGGLITAVWGRRAGPRSASGLQASTVSPAAARPVGVCTRVQGRFLLPLLSC